MPKTITVRIEDDVYDMFKKAADGERRTISNFIEYAALSYLIDDIYVSDDEMNDILSDKPLLKSIKQGLENVKKGQYKFVG